MKRSQPRRNWEAAREKVDREGCCRIMFGKVVPGPMDGGCGGPLEAAHIVGREHDKTRPQRELGPSERWMPYTVAPDRIVPLCKKHHQMYDAHQLDLLGYLTVEEEAQAVLDAGSLESARRRLCPSEYRREAA